MAAPAAQTSPAQTSPAETARRVMRGRDRAALATLRPATPGPDPGTDSSGADGPWPYPSLVLVAFDHDGSPLLLLSELADHTRNIKADARVGLLFDGTAGLDEPLTGARVSVLGRAKPTDEPRHRARYLARHPDAALYAGFADFRIFRVSVERAHLVAGFGRIHWVEGRDILFASDATEILAQCEVDVVQHMNEDHADAVELYATVLLGRAGGGWRMTGIDPDGCDLRLGAEYARLEFDRPATDAQGARAELVRLARLARGQRGE